MARDLTYVALDAIAFITGATLSAMLGHMQYRVDRATGRLSGYLLLWLLGFIWTFGNFMRCTLELAGAMPDSTAARFAETFAWSCTLLGPLTVGRLVQGGIGSTRSEERRVGKECCTPCRSRWSPDHCKKKQTGERDSGSRRSLPALSAERACG